MKNIIYAVKGRTGWLTEMSKKIFQKEMNNKFKTIVFLASAIFCAGLIYIVYLQAVTIIVITSIKPFNNLENIQSELLSLNNIIALHEYAIASSSCFLAGVYFISTSGKFR